MIKLFLNGCWRKVLIDDRFPCLARKKKGGRLLCSSSTRPAELFVSLIEKAYMKVHGGYNFNGSNSGIDLFCLTGWIPEQVYLSKNSAAGDQQWKRRVRSVRGDDSDSDSDDGNTKSSDLLDHKQDKDRVWDRIQSAHKFGDTLITVSTAHNLTQEQLDSTGLIPGHAYAVLDVIQAGTLRLLKVQNPWRSCPWLGRFSCSTLKESKETEWTPGLMKFLEIIELIN